MKKLICFLLSCVFVFGLCSTLPKQTDAAESSGEIEVFANKVTRMIKEYGNLPQVDVYSKNDSLSEYETCRLIVKSKEKIDTLNAVSVISGYRNLTVLQFETPYDAAEAYEYYSSLGCVEYVQPDRPVKMQSADDFTQEQKTWGSEMTRTTEVCNYFENAELYEVKVAVIDSGIDYNNDIFEGRLVDNGINLSSSGDETGKSDDPKSHGTHIAGVIAMNTPEEIKLRSYKIFDFKGNSTELLVITAIDFAVADGMDIINLSLGTSDSDALRECLQDAYDSGSVIVTASGNKGVDCADILPASFKGAITVGAVDPNGKPADFSNYGTTLDIVAPGVDIYSCINNNDYGLISGTSVATPFVTAASAILRGYNSELSPDEIEALLKENAIPVDGTYSKTKTGSGILNIAQALECPRANESEIIITESTDSVTVSFSEAENTDTYYTFDGGYPTEKTSLLYDEPFTVTTSGEITWRSFSDDGSLFASKARSEKIRVFVAPDDSLFTVDNNGVLLGYSGNDTSVIVPETVGGITVVAIGGSAFSGSKASFKELVLPDTVKSVGEKAFRLNKTIEYVKADGLETIGESAFSGCSSLEILDAPNVKTVSGYAFNKCSSLSVFNSAKVTEIGEYAFTGVEKISELKLDKLEKLGSHSFEDSYIKVFHAPALKKIETAAFASCVYLHEVNFESVETVEAQALSGCKNLSELYLPNAVTIGARAFTASEIKFIRFEKLESCEAYLSNDCTVILPSTVTYLGFDSNYIVNDVHLKIYAAPDTYAEKWANSGHYNCKVEFISLPSVISSFPEYLTDETEISVEAIGFNLTYQWYGSVDGSKNNLVLLDGETEKCFNIPEYDRFAGYYCTVTSTENGVSSSETKGTIYADMLPADYSAYNSAKARVPSDLSIYTDETVTVLTAALSVDVSGKTVTGQAVIDAQTRKILDAISALRLKAADYSAVYAAVANVPTDLSSYTPDSVKALQSAIDSVDYTLDITAQRTVDTYAENINKAIDNLEEESFFARIFRLIKEFFEKLFSF